MAKITKKTVKKAIPKVVKQPIEKPIKKAADVYKETETDIYKIEGTANHFQLLEINKKTNEKKRVLTSGGTTLQNFNRICDLYFKNK